MKLLIQILPLLHYLMNNDITLIFEKAPRFMKRDYLQAILSEPLPVCEVSALYS